MATGSCSPAPAQQPLASTSAPRDVVAEDGPDHPARHGEPRRRESLLLTAARDSVGASREFTHRQPAGDGPAVVAGKPSILIGEHEADILEHVRYHRDQEGYVVDEADSGEKALERAAATRPALIILDLMLPGTDGLEVCRRLRTDDTLREVPVIMLTAKGTEVDRILGLELGADDYITKPFSPRELVARVRAVLRRAASAAGPPDESFLRGRLQVNFDTYEVAVDGRPVALSLREFELLKFFEQHPHRVYDRLQLLDLVWGQDVHVEPRTVDVHVRRLRKVIERDDSTPELLLTVRGVGYKFNPDALEP